MLTHSSVSFFKSGIRILAGVALVIEGWQFDLGWIIVAGLLLIAAEILGILEELV